MTKRCYKCGETKPREAFRRDRSRKDGLQSKCSFCHSVYVAANRAAVLAKKREHSATYGPGYRSANRQILNEKANARYRADPITQNKRTAGWRTRNLQKAKDAVRRVELANRPAKYAANAKRRALLLQAFPAWANLEAIVRVYEEAHRLTLETGILHHVDHEVPLQSPVVCGLHCESNLRAVPASVNLSKSNLWDTEAACS